MKEREVAIYERRNTSRRAIGNDATEKKEEGEEAAVNGLGVFPTTLLLRIFSRRHRQRRHCLAFSRNLLV